MSARLKRVHDWEDLATTAKFHVGLMADLCPTTCKTLQRFFRHTFRKSPKQWIRELRCRKALQLLAEGYSNKGIVQKLCFANEAHFCHDFKKIYGVSPQTMGPLFENSSGLALLHKNVGAGISTLAKE
jgi:AraC-like DNA-binding protein